MGVWSFLAMVFGAMRTQDGGLAGPHWLLVTYIVITWGELCLSPVGLSMVTKLAPIRLQSAMMGVWFFTMSLSNLFAGLVAYVSTQVKSGEWTFFIPGLPGFFLMLVVFPVGMGILQDQNPALPAHHLLLAPQAVAITSGRSTNCVIYARCRLF